MPSNVIRDFVYAADRHELTVIFISGKVYVYSLVPPAIAAAFSEAVSPGVFFNSNVRDRYPYRKGRRLVSEAASSSLREALLGSS
jgi:hypothetical protein